MLGFPLDTKHESKCIVTHGTMGHIDPKQPPTKRKPFASLLNQQFVQKVDIILPEELYEIVKDGFFTDRAKPTYSRVILPLGALLEGEFFNEYIKRGNILMLSEWRTGVDRLYSLREGILTLYLDKASYERAGIVGKPDGVKGKRGTKPRWIVEINLRLPSMLHGKRGFDRIVYAFKNVLNIPVTWLFCDLGALALTPDPLDAHFPVRFTASPSIRKGIKANVPPLEPPAADSDSGYRDDFEDFAVETHEWLSLISLESPRIDPGDGIDTFLSRYVPPGDPSRRLNLVRVTWQGFFSPAWVHKIFVETLFVTPRESWFAYSAMGFSSGWLGGTKDCTILKSPHTQNEFVVWEVA